MKTIVCGLFMLCILLVGTANAVDDWTQVFPSSKPSARFLHAMAYLGDDQVLFPQKLLEQGQGGEVLPGLDAAHEAQRHAADLVVDHELREALAALEIEHPRSGDVVDARQRRQARPHAALQTRLGVEQVAGYGATGL